MYRRILLLSLIFILGCSACAKRPAIGTAEGPGSVVPMPAVTLTPEEDPDGDGENKGYAYFSKTRPATGNTVFIFDPNYHAWAVYNADGDRINVGKASGGQLYCSDVKRPCKTVVGTFKILSKGTADCKSHTFPIKTHGGAPMPYCMMFDSQGFFVHGSNEIPDRNASHGCIRVSPIAAKWLNEDFLTVGSTVIVLPYKS